jgi:hypothetical protein
MTSKYCLGVVIGGVFEGQVSFKTWCEEREILRKLQGRFEEVAPNKIPQSEENAS